MEFLNDRFLTAMVAWDLNGKLFNRIPLLKKLKWREYIGIKMLWGGLSDKNNPFLAQNADSPLLMAFPEGLACDESQDTLCRGVGRYSQYLQVVTCRVCAPPQLQCLSFCS